MENVYHFMRDAKWDNEGMLAQCQNEFSKLLSIEGGMITGDGTDFPKKGRDSVGVGHHYCGNTGKIDNCQAAVMVGYLSKRGHCLLDYELCPTKDWFIHDSDTEAEMIEKEIRRKKSGIPENLDHHETKNEILLRMINKTYNSGNFATKYVGVDSSFGRDHKFLDGLPSGLVYFADIPCNHLVFPSRYKVVEPEHSGQTHKPLILSPSPNPIRVDAIANDDSIPWDDVILGIGAKGPIFGKYKHIKVFESRNGKPGNPIWLYIRQLEDHSQKFSLCNESMDATLTDIRKPALMRWSLEQSFEECKKYLGMDHYQTRKWRGWRRHMLMTLIAHQFILKMMHKYTTKRDYQYEIPIPTEPIDFDEYIKEVKNCLEDRSKTDNSPETPLNTEANPSAETQGDADRPRKSGTKVINSRETPLKTEANPSAETQGEAERPRKSGTKMVNSQETPLNTEANPSAEIKVDTEKLRKSGAKTNHSSEISETTMTNLPNEKLGDIKNTNKNKSTTQNSVKSFAEAPQRFMTIGIIMEVVNGFLVKTGNIMKVAAYRIKENADAFMRFTKGKIRKWIPDLVKEI
jgi:SRSO17 transposase